MSQQDVINFRNLSVRSQLALVVHWLDDQDVSLVFSLRRVTDAFSLYEHGLRNNPRLGRLAAEWHGDEIVSVIGYNPFEEKNA